LDSSGLETPLLPLSWGEVFDKVTILGIKSERFTDPLMLENVRRELGIVLEVIGDMGRFPPELPPLLAALRKINEELWHLEDEIRKHEMQERFDEVFISLARRVYFTNDRRSEVKSDINRLLGSRLVEEKSYAGK